MNDTITAVLRKVAGFLTARAVNRRVTEAIADEARPDRF